MLTIILDNLDTFFKNSVLSVPLLIFIIALYLKNKILFLIVLGILLTHLSNKLIKIGLSKLPFIPKYIIYRPPGASKCDGSKTNNKSDNLGFPSGHSQFIFFLAIILILTTNNYIFYPIIIILAIMISISRLGWNITNPLQFKNPCHTPLQVIIGAVIGLITGYYYTLFILPKK